MNKFFVTVWFRSKFEDKDFEVHEIDALDENCAKRKAYDLYNKKSVIPFKIEVAKNN